MAKRTPCNSARTVVGNGGGCYQHKKVSEQSVTLFENSTKVPDYAETPDPSGIAPFARPNSVEFWPSCAGYPSDCEPPDPPCGEYLGLQTAGGTEWRSDAGFPAASGTVVDLNGYTETETTEDRSACRRLGHKVVQAAKVFHGQHGFTSEYYKPNTGCANDESCEVIPCRAESTVPDQTKYLTKTVAATLSLFLESGDVEFSSTASQTVSVDRNSGVKTITAYDWPDPCAFDSWPDMRDNGPVQPPEPISISDFLARFDTYNLATINGSDGGAGSLIGWGYPVSGDRSCTETSWTNVWSEEVPGETEPVNGQTLEETTNDFAGHATRKQYLAIYPSGDEGVAGMSFELVVTITATTIEWHAKVYGVKSDGSGTWLQRDYHITVALSDSWTSADVYTAVKALAAEWDMTDDLKLPWRTDGYLSVGPLVTRNEVPSAVVPSIVLPPTVDNTGSPIADCAGNSPEDESWTPTYEQVTWTDPQGEYYDGSVRGAPLPAGYPGHFDWRHKTYRWCRDDSLGTEAIWIAYHGAKSAASVISDGTDSVVPANATQWTNNAQAAQLPAGAGVYYFGDQFQFAISGLPGSTWGTGVMVIQKTAQTKVPRPSENFARPCNLDRLAIDEETALCGFVFSASDPDHPVIGLLSTPTFSAGDLLLIDLGSSSDGVWEFASMIDNRVTLANKRTDLPAHYTARDGGIVGKLRWPQAPAFCGRLNISSATQNDTNVDIVLATDANIWVGDSIDFTCTGSLGSAETVVSVTDSKHFSVEGTLGSYTFGGSITVNGASEDWNDDETKGDLIYAVYEQNLRDYQERDRVRALDNACHSDDDPIREQQAANGYPQAVSNLILTQIGPGSGCVPWSVCNPQVFAASPNGEEFPNGVTKPFPETFAIDSVYGSQWQSDFYQHVDSVFWQAPHDNCEHIGEGTWTEDTGECTEDDPLGETRYYPHRPKVEARLAKPAGAPDLPVPYGFLTFAEIQSSSPPDGLMAAAPAGATGYVKSLEMPPVTHEGPWSFFLTQKNCVCGGGRFAAEYAADMVPCDQICPE